MCVCVCGGGGGDRGAVFVRKCNEKCRARLKPVLNWANIASPNIVRSIRRTLLRFSIELIIR